MSVKHILFAFILSAAFSSCVDFEESIFDNISNEEVATRAAGSDKTPYFYYYKGEKQYFELDTRRIFISMSDEAKIKEFASNAAKNRSMRFDATKKNYKNSFWTAVTLDGKLSDEAYLAKLNEIKTSRKDIIVAPYFKNEYTDNIGLSNFFYVKLKQESDAALLEQEAAKVNAVIDHQNEFMPLWYVLSVTENSEFNAMELSNRFYESGLFQYAVPDFLTKDELGTFNDPRYDQQWGLNNTGQSGGVPGMDINAEQAWQISTGNNVIVAVLDKGVQLEHPDLAANIYPESFDSRRGTLTNPLPQRYENDEHGTTVAGVVGAERGNGTGIAGVAPDCKIMSVSNPLVEGELETRANGISWAWRNGADVINNSWYSAIKNPIIEEAIHEAVTEGRGGKGCVVVFCSDNSGVPRVAYPGTLPDVIAVGAVNRTGVRAYFSNYGTELDVVAPGEGIWTTVWGGGHRTINGTSIAAPHVSGVAALILSVNPNLTQRQVVDIIEKTARKVSYGKADPTTGHIYNYIPTSGHPNGTWDNQLGYGLVDAYAALISPLTGITFSNQTVYGDMSFIKNNIWAHNITVKSGASLTLQAPNITINQPFVVEAGGGLILTH